ncbi:hypothetical protein QJS10_CPA08g01918 [Acorus calamus]|uniref:Uncharacterized protein n=1 Tax=Acorus calamus TaxID=4465 RepID=A0AAV9E9W0_ACOCL|nr:hypothetical protein QJS10_CPA08g01918 [Acorus calamus]
MALEGKGSSENGFGRKGVSDGDSRRRRSASVARHRRGDLEARDVEMKSASESNARRRRSLSVARYRGSDSESYSSALTEDEGWSSHANKYGIEKTIRAVYAQNKIDHPIGDEEETGFYEAMRTEVRHAVEEMRTELEQVMGKGQSNAPTNGFKLRSPDISQDITEMRKNYTTKLEQSEKRKQDLLAELAVEEQRARELSQVVKDLLPEPKSTAPVSRPSRNRRRSDDKTRMSKCLTEEAEKYFEDFISNVEDTDVSSFDGEKSDASSTLGGSIKSRIRPLYCAIDEMEENLARGTSLPVDLDGVILPWLQWETSNDCSPLLCKSNTVGNNLLSAAQESSPVCNNSIYFTSSRGSCSGPGKDDSPSMISKSKVVINSDDCRRGSVFDIEEYQHLQRSEDLLLERLRLRPRIESGGLVICGADFYLNFL